jgi:hypothetical protein
MEHSGTIVVLMRRFGKFNKANFSLAKFLQKISICLDWILIKHILDAGGGGKFNTQLIRLKVFQSDIYHFQGESSSIFSTASVLVGSSVCKRS